MACSRVIPAEAVVGHEAVSHRDDSVGDLADLSRVRDDDEGLAAVLVKLGSSSP